MEETTTGQAAAPEAPPGGDVAVAEAPPATVEADVAAPIDVTQFPDFDDPAATEAWIAASTEATNAEAGAETETAVEAADPTATAATEATAAAPPSAPATAEAPKPADETPDDATIAEYLKSRGFKIEAPAPPPTPFQELTSQLDPLVGTPEQYAEAQRIALQPVEDTDPEWTEKTAARDKAAADLRRMNDARQITGISREWATQRQNGMLGSALSALPQQYGLTPERAARVTNPTSMTDAVNAVAEQITATAEAKLAERERYWQGQVAKAGADKAAANLQQMGRAPQAGNAPGGRATAPGAAWGNSALPDEAWIQKAISGQLANVDLS